MWVPPETQRPVLPHHPTRGSVGCFGTVRLRDGKMVFAREGGRFNAETCWNLLKQLRISAAHSGRRVVVILDNARCHHARLHQDWRQKAFARFALDFLPPYSPELNPVERAWKLTRRPAIHNRCFPHLDTVIESVENQFAQGEEPNDPLRVLCAII